MKHSEKVRKVKDFVKQNIQYIQYVGIRVTRKIVEFLSLK